MINPLHLYPTLHEDDVEKIFSPLFETLNGERVCNYHFYFPSDYGKTALNIIKDEFDDSYRLEDEFGEWGPNKHPLYYERKLKIYHPSSLYGTGEYAIAASEAKIGIALKWTSKGSRRRGAIRLTDIPCQDADFEININKSFPKGNIFGDLNLSLILYISNSCSHLNDGEEKFANNEGDILGEIDNISIVLDGNGSFLPIYEDFLEGEGLWTVICNWTEPTLDPFNQAVSIILNKANKQYKYIDSKNTKYYNRSYLLQIIGNAMAVVIETLRCEDPDFKCLDKFEEGSVAQAIKYFRDQLEWDLSAPISTSKSINKYFEKNTFGL